MTDIVLGGEKGTGLELALFKSENVVSISIYFSSAEWKGDMKWSATVTFKKDTFQGSNNFDGVSLVDIAQQIQVFIDSL